MARKRAATARKRTRTDSVPSPAVRRPALPRTDSYANAITGLGTTRDKRLGGQVAFAPMGYQEAEDLWRGDDMAAKVIEEPAREMTRKWLDVQIEPDADEDPTKAKEASEAAEKALLSLGAKKHVRDAIMRQRAFGGSVILVGARDGQEDLTKPLDEKKLQSVDFLTVFDAFECYPRSWYVDAQQDKFGEPETYWVNPAGLPGSPVATMGARASKPNQLGNVVHESRLLRFESVKVSRRAAMQNRGWPDSSLVRVRQVLADFGMSWDGAAHLLQDFAQAVFRMRGLAEASAAGAEGEQLIRKRLEDVELGRSLLRAIVLDAGQGNGEPMEEFERKATPVAGLAELLDRFSNRLAAAADMPVTRLMGQSPAGLNATGQQDENWWFDRMAGAQDEVLREPLTRLVNLLFLCKEGPTKGVVPENWSIQFRPLKQESAMELADRMSKLASAHATWIGAKVLTPEEVAVSTFGGDELSAHIHIDKERRKEATGLRPVLELDPASLQGLIAVWQAQGLAFSEMRTRLRNAGLATLSDEKAKDEMEAAAPAGAGAMPGATPGAMSEGEGGAAPPRGEDEAISGGEDEPSAEDVAAADADAAAAQADAELAQAIEAATGRSGRASAKLKAAKNGRGVEKPGRSDGRDVRPGDVVQHAGAEREVAAVTQDGKGGAQLRLALLPGERKAVVVRASASDPVEVVRRADCGMDEPVHGQEDALGEATRPFVVPVVVDAHPDDVASALAEGLRPTLEKLAERGDGEEVHVEMERDEQGRLSGARLRKRRRS